MTDSTELLRYCDRELCPFSLDLVTDDDGSKFWEMEVDGWYFQGATASECFTDACIHFIKQKRGEPGTTLEGPI